MVSERELEGLRRAVDLARGIDLAGDPNPSVGAVLLSPDGIPIAEGIHRGAGTAHAEVVALRAAGASAAGATMLVSLEPCAHVGRTGPCTSALLEAGVRRVVYASTDPNPVAAGGADVLRRAGVSVEHHRLVPPVQRPFVTWKVATSLDGRSAAADGTSRWITCDDARHDVHRLRAGCDAILVGTGTVVADDPRLTARTTAGDPLPPRRQPLRAVMGLRDLDPSYAVFDAAAETVRLRTRDPAVAVERLAERGCRHVWLEGGPTLAAAFLRAGVVDEVVAYVAPALLGSGAAAVADLGIPTVGSALRLELCDVTRVGTDVRLTMKVPR